LLKIRFWLFFPPFFLELKKVFTEDAIL